MTVINTVLSATIFGSLMTALDRLGLKPELTARQAARVISPMLEGLSKQIIGETPSAKLEKFAEQLTNFVKIGGVADPNFEATFENNVFTEKLTNCMYISMANFGKKHGYDACPLCGMALITMGALNALGEIEVTGYTVECDGKNCAYKMTLREKK